MLFFGRGWRERTGAGVGLPQMQRERGGREQGRRNCKNHFGREINED